VALGYAEKGDVWVVAFHCSSELPPVFDGGLHVVLWFAIGEGGKCGVPDHLSADRDNAADAALGSADVLNEFYGGW